MSDRLRVGDRAPEFELRDSQGALFSLKFPREKAVLLSFFRYASCPLCNLRVHELRERSERWAKQGLEVIGVFQSPVERFEEYVGKQAPAFPLLSDPSEASYALYGVGVSTLGFLDPVNLVPLARAASKGYLPGAQDGSVTRVPAEFLIDREGKIERVFYAKRAGDHLPFEIVEDWLG